MNTFAPTERRQAVKIVAVCDARTVVLPPELLSTLGANMGDTLYIVRLTEGVALCRCGPGL
jgi:bifunctional DNA-binding transcriptional regulator/antitoxin component of YhaV-PrlF toxin-antitoxin module